MIKGLCWEDGKETVKDVGNLIQPIINYEQLVTQFIREKYSLDEELALNRQREVKIIEFEEYNNYCEDCKRRAKTLLNII